jgi:putative addiction module component (TIGR02574 family)
MSFEQLLEELPALSFEQRQALIRRVVEIDEPTLSLEDEAEIERRLAAHRENPGTALPADQMLARLKARFSK